MKTNPVAHALSSVLVGPETTLENLTMLPLLRPRSPAAPAAPFSTSQHPSAPFSTHGIDYDVLDDSLASGVVEITELGRSGSVPNLHVTNKGAKPVIIIDGEELVGANQNRIVNLTILVAAQSELTIPVSCVEAGRWRPRSRVFASAPRAQYATGRAKRMKHVTDSMAATGYRRSDQADVWADIALKSARLHAASPTSAMEAMFVSHSKAIGNFVEACEPADGQVGALFAVNDRIVGFDLFDRESTLRKILPKLVRSVAIEALDPELGELGTGPFGAWAAAAKGPVPNSGPAAAGQFLAAVAAAPQQVVKALGLGDDVRLTAPGLVGAGLVVDGTALHVSAFTQM